MEHRFEVKIFLTLFLLYSFFIYWATWNEDTRFFLTRAIVDENRFEIDTWYNQTGDRAFYDGHYYSDKDPGVSLLATPLYYILRKISPLIFGSTNRSVCDTYFLENYIPIVHCVAYDPFISTSKILMTLFTSSLFSSLMVLTFYKLSKIIFNNRKTAVFLAFVLGVGTLVLHSAIIFRDYGSATLFSFLGFYLLFRMKHEKNFNRKILILSGLLMGFSMTITIVSSITCLSCLLYLFFTHRKGLMYFLLGCVLGLLPFILYNTFSFEHPFTLPRFYLDPAIWSGMEGEKGIKPPNIFVGLRLLFYPYKGLFFYYPILLFSLVGMTKFYNNYRIETGLILLIFLAHVIVNSSWWAWWGGASFGPRHLVLAIPFMLLPLGCVLEEKARIVRVVVMIFLLVSVFHNFSGLQHIPDEMIDLKHRTRIKHAYSTSVSSLKILLNPLYDYYVPRFLKDGPRSLMFENLINRKIIDIDYWPMYYYFGGPNFQNDRVNLFNLGSMALKLKIPFLCLVPLSMGIIFIWRKEILKKERIDIFLAILFLVCLIFLEIRPLEIEESIRVVRNFTEYLIK